MSLCPSLYELAEEPQIGETLKQIEIMNEVTKALLKNLQEDLDRIKLLESNMEIVWKLETMKKNIDFLINLFVASIK